MSTGVNLAFKALYKQESHRYSATFRNGVGNQYELNVLAANKIGLLGRISLVFSRRGFSISSLQFKQLSDKRLAEVHVKFTADSEQFNQVKNDINKIIDVIQINVTIIWFIQFILSLSFIITLA